MTPENKNPVQTEETVTADVVMETEDTVTANPEPETTPEPNAPQPPAYKLGVVVDCVKLNVREHSNANAKVLCTIPKGTKVAAFESESYGEFYRIETAAGVKGFCMKKYVDVNR